MIDTHAHLYLEEFAGDLDAVIARAKEAGVEKIFLPSIHNEVVEAMLKLKQHAPGFFFPMIGLHPCSVADNYEIELREIPLWLDKEKFVAIGEIGLDFYWSREFEKQQYDAFHHQIELALEVSLPIVIHSRNATAECIDVVKEHQDGRLKGIFHCFSGSYEQAMKIIDRGFYLGIGGVITFKNAGLAESLKDVPMEYLVLETDAPYLSPVPFRGKRNESSYLVYIAEKLAAVKGTTREEVVAVTTANALRLFGV